MYCEDNAKRPGQAWSKSKVPVDANMAFEDAMELWGDIYLHEISREMCREFAKLQEKRPRKNQDLYLDLDAKGILEANIPKSVRRRGNQPKEVVGRLSTFLAWAVTEQHASYNPAEKLPVQIIEGSETEVWADSEIQHIFTPELLEKQPNLKNPNGKGKSWVLVMLLMAYTGARLNEITYLRTDDFKEEDEHSSDQIPAIIIDYHEDRRLKNKGSRRKVPLHPHLEKVGIIEYFKQRKAAGRHYLLELHKKGNERGKAFGKHVTQNFNNYRDQLGYPADRTKMLESFRQTFITKAETKLGFDNNRIITGHGAGDVHDRHYVRRMQMDLTDLYEAVAKIDFGLDLETVRQILETYVPEYPKKV